jgi:Ice-binding-like
LTYLLRGNMTLRAFSLLVLGPVLSLLAVSARADTINIGTAAPFAVLGEAGVTNTGPSIIFGSVAGSTGTPAVTGFPPGTVVPPGVLFLAGVANSGPGTPFGDATAAFNFAEGLSAINEGTVSLGAGGLSTLAPGVYTFTSATVLLNGLLQLDAGGSNTAMWTFQIPFALTTASASSVQVVNAGANGPFGGSITWAVGSAATLGTTTGFLGTIISQAGDRVLTGATIGCGRVISLDASVTLDTNVIDTPADCMVTGGKVGPPAAVPEPASFAFLASGLLATVFLTFRKSRVSSGI